MFFPTFASTKTIFEAQIFFHGVGGELNVIDAPTENKLYDLFIDAGADVGLPRCDDFNGADQEGLGRYQATLKNAKRCSSASAFLTPVLKRPNLTVLTNANVNKLILDGHKVTGIEYSTQKGIETASCKNEVVLSAGTVKNPQILQLSGIGHPDDLSAVGIETRVELPGVGRNLQEHLDVIQYYKCNEKITLNSNANPLLQVKALFQYYLFKSGVAAGNVAEAGGFARTSPDLDIPDIQFHFIPAYMTAITDPLPRQHGLTIRACKLRPESTGSITLNSADPTDAPLIDFNFLDKEADIETLVKAYRLSEKIMASGVWGNLVGDRITPEPDVQSDEDVRTALRDITDTVYHPVGTCKMGNDEMAVVDAQLKAHKLKGLRIADASIMPHIISGNTSAPAMMIGEKCADMMLSE